MSYVPAARMVAMSLLLLSLVSCCCNCQPKTPVYERYEGPCDEEHSHEPRCQPTPMNNGGGAL